MSSTTLVRNALVWLVATVALGAPTFVQQGPAIVPLIAGVDDTNNVPLGSEIALRCAVVGDGGAELQTLPDGRSVSSLGLTLRLDRGPQGGFAGTLGQASARGTVEIIGLYVFRCDAGPNVDVSNLGNRPGVAAVRAPGIQTTRVQLLRSTVDIPDDSFEVGESLRVSALALDSGGEPIRIDAPQVTIRTGRVDCGSESPLAFRDFRTGPRQPWTPGLGHVAEFIPQRLGTYSFIVSQSSGQGLNICDALPVTIEADARPPEVSIRLPAGPQVDVDIELIRVEGSISKTPDRLREVIVSNGHWSEEPRLFPVQGESRTRYFSDLPFEPGLNLITVTATDVGGNTRRAVRAVVAGSTFTNVPTFTDEGFQGRRELWLEIGRSLVIDTSPPIDSLSELAERLDPLLELAGREFSFETESVDEQTAVDVLPGIFTFLIAVDVRGEVTPGRLDFGLVPRAERLDLVIRAPLRGDLVLSPAIGRDREVDVGGAVELVLPLQMTTIGGVQVKFALDEVRVEDRLRLRVVPADEDAADQVRGQILDRVEVQARDALAMLFGCEDGVCTPPEPPLTSLPTGGGQLLEGGVLIAGGERDHHFDSEFADPLNSDRSLQTRIGLLFDSLEVLGSRIQAMISPSFRTSVPDVTPPSSLGRLVDLGRPRNGSVRDIGQPDLRAWFGSGNRDIQGAVHLQALNELLAQLWASDVFQMDRNLVDVLSAAGFFPDPTDEGLARFALGDARLRVSLHAPPRLAYYDGASGLFAEIGPVRVEIDLTVPYESRIVLEGGLTTTVGLSATPDGRSLRISVTDPTGCAPNGTLFMNCDGHFEIGVVEREGLTGLMPAPLGERARDEVLARLGAKTSADGRFRSDHEFDLFWRDQMAAAVNGLLSGGLPEVDLPEITVPGLLEPFGLRSLEFSSLRFHPRANGGRIAEGWIAFELNLGAKPEN